MSRWRFVLVGATITDVLLWLGKEVCLACLSQATTINFQTVLFLEMYSLMSLTGHGERCFPPLFHTVIVRESIFSCELESSLRNGNVRLSVRLSVCLSVRLSVRASELVSARYLKNGCS